MKLISLNDIYHIDPKNYKENERVLQLLSKKNDIKLFNITDNVKNWLTEEKLENNYIIDIRDIKEELNKQPFRTKFGSWIALDKRYFES